MKGLYNIFRTTSSQALREPVFLILTGVFAVLVYGARFLVMFVFRGRTRVLMETGITSISSCGVLLSILLSWLLIRKEMERMSILSVLSKPVSRFSFVTGKYMGLLYAIGAAMFFLFLVFLLNLWQFNSVQMLDEIQHQIYQEFLADPAYRKSGSSPGGVWIILQGLQHGFGHFFRKWLVPSMIGTVPAMLSVSIVLSVCAVSSLYFNVTTTTGVTIAFLVFGNLAGNLFHALQHSGWIIGPALGWVVHLLIPDLLRLNIASDVGSRLSLSRLELFYDYLPFLSWSVVSSLVYVMMLLTAGSAIFQRKEIR